MKLHLGYNKKFLVTCVYRAPAYKTQEFERDSETLELIVSDLVRTKKAFFILGDFNLPQSKHYNYLKRILQQYSLRQLVNVKKGKMLD